MFHGVSVTDIHQNRLAERYSYLFVPKTITSSYTKDCLILFMLSKVDVSSTTSLGQKFPAPPVERKDSIHTVTPYSHIFTLCNSDKVQKVQKVQRRYSRDFSVGVQSTSANLELRGFICMIAA